MRTHGNYVRRDVLLLEAPIMPAHPAEADLRAERGRSEQGRASNKQRIGVYGDRSARVLYCTVCGCGWR